MSKQTHDISADVSPRIIIIIISGAARPLSPTVLTAVLTIKRHFAPISEFL